MVKKAKLFKHKERKSRSEVSEFLGQLSQKIADGQVVLRQSQEDLILEMPHNMSLKVNANKKKKRVKGMQHKFTIQLTWYEDDHQEDTLVLG